MAAKRILILERLGEAERILSYYINQHFPDYDVDFLGNVDTADTTDIINRVKQADIIMTQSIFDDTTSFEKMVMLFSSLNITDKPVHIIHTINRLIYSLSKLDAKVYSELATMLHFDGLQLFNVYYNEFEHPENKDKQGFFRKTIFKFDAVKVWYDEVNKVIWDERPMFISNFSRDYFKPAAPKERVNFFNKLNNADSKVLKEILIEMKAILDDRVEDIESGSYNGDDVDELMASHKKQLAVLNKLNVN